MRWKRLVNHPTYPPQKYPNPMNHPDRFNAIMAMVDAWADHHAGWDCRDEAEAEVAFILGDDRFAGVNDEWIAESAINAWMEAE